jgi:hypothetical protein
MNQRGDLRSLAEVANLRFFFPPTRSLIANQG